jgi:hypothetical protein
MVSLIFSSSLHLLRLLRSKDIVPMLKVTALLELAASALVLLRYILINALLSPSL